MIKSRLLPVLGIIALTSSSIGAGDRTVERFAGYSPAAEVKGPAYADEWEAVQNLDFTSAQALGWNEKHPVFAAGLKALMAGDYGAAQRSFNLILETSADSLERRQAGNVLREVLLFQSKWSELLALDLRHALGLDENNIMALVRAYQTAPTETWIFPERGVEVKAWFGLAGAPEIEVEINGNRKRFLIDTGAEFTVLASDLAEACGVEPLSSEKTLSETSTDAKVLILPAVVRELRIGALAVKNHPVIILDKKDLEFKLFGLIKIFKISGILGWNAIKRMDITLDYRGRIVRIQKPAEKKNPARNFFWMGYPFIKVASPSGRVLHFGLDTGANETYVSDLIFSKIDTAGMKTKRVRIGGAGGKLESVQTREIPRLQMVIGSNLLTFKGVRCGKSIEDTFFKFDGILGSDAAKDGIMRLDFTNGRFELDFSE